VPDGETTSPPPPPPAAPVDVGHVPPTTPAEAQEHTLPAAVITFASSEAGQAVATQGTTDAEILAYCDDEHWHS
jgi:hypothetical protein